MANLSKFGDRWNAVKATIAMTLGWVRAAKDMSTNQSAKKNWQDFGAALSGTSAAMAYVLPPPFNLAVAGGLASIGGLITVAFTDKPPTNKEIVDRMDESFREVQAKFEEQGEKLDSLVNLTAEMDRKLQQILDILTDKKVLRLDDVKDITLRFRTAEGLKEFAAELNTTAAWDEYTNYLTLAIDENRHFIEREGPASADNVRQAFITRQTKYRDDPQRVIKGNCEAGMISSGIQAAHGAMFDMLMTQSQFTGRLPRHRTLLQQDAEVWQQEVSQVMRTFLEQQNEPVEEWMQRFQFPDYECERACLSSDCVIQSTATASSIDFPSGLCLHMGSAAAPSEAYLSNCTDSTSVILKPNHRVVAPSGRDDTLSCLTLAEGEEKCGRNIEECVAVEACGNASDVNDTRHEVQQWDLDQQGYLRPLSRKRDLNSCVRPFPKRYGRFELEMTILWARNLPNVDWIGETDAYVVCKINGDIVARTRTTNNDLNPRWYHVFNWTVDEGEPVPQMECELWDAQSTSKDRVLPGGRWNMDLHLNVGEHLIVKHPSKSGEVRFRYRVSQCHSGFLASGTALTPDEKGLYKTQRGSSFRGFPIYYNLGGKSLGQSGQRRPPVEGEQAWQLRWNFNGHWTRLGRWNQRPQRPTATCPDLGSWPPGISMKPVVPLEIGECSSGAEFALRREPVPTVV